MGMADKKTAGACRSVSRPDGGICSPADLVRLHDTAEVLWGHDQQMVGEAADRFGNLAERGLPEKCRPKQFVRGMTAGAFKDA